MRTPTVRTHRLKTRRRLDANRRSDPWRFVREGDAAWQRERVVVALLDGEQRILWIDEVAVERPVLALRYLAQRLRRVAGKRAATLVCVHNLPGRHARAAPPQGIAEQIQDIASRLGVARLEYETFRAGRYRRVAP